jgi:hypothetical protein
VVTTIAAKIMSTIILMVVAMNVVAIMRAMNVAARSYKAGDAVVMTVGRSTASDGGDSECVEVMATVVGGRGGERASRPERTAENGEAKVNALTPDRRLPMGGGPRVGLAGRTLLSATGKTEDASNGEEVGSGG